MPSCLLGYFAVMLRQAAFAALVVYHKSTLPSPLTCLPCLTVKYSNRWPGLFCRDAAFAALVTYREQIHSEIARGG